MLGRLDTVEYDDAAGAVTVNLATGLASGADGTDTLATFENLLGSAFPDDLTGDGLANVITGGDGDDVIDGGPSGPDDLDGGAGDDICSNDNGGTTVNCELVELVALGWNGTIVVSPNGVTWTSQPSGTGANLWASVWDGTQWIIVGNGGAVRTSPDGVTWTSQASGFGGSLLGVV